MRIIYRKDFGDEYHFLLAAAPERVSINTNNIERIANKMYEDVRRADVCATVVTILDEKYNKLIVFGIVCDECEPGPGSGEEILCNIMKEVRGDGEDRDL